jgi:RNA-directed DNA polymerase
MNEGDADRMAEKPESRQKAATGSREDMAAVRQAFTVTEEQAFSKTETLLEQVVERENLMQALKRVRANKGAPGVDGMTVEDLGPYLKAHWIQIREELLSGRYEPQAVRGVDIPKSAGGTRRLGIPTVIDRFIQQAILQVLTPLIDPTFSKASYGYRPGRSAQQAVQSGRKHVEAGFRWVVDLDLEQFFDRVNHDILMSRMARRIKDKRLLKLLRRFLEAGMMVEGVVQEHGQGTPQGGPLSPLLSNVLLDELDKELEQRGHRFCRYADDCNVYVRSKAAGERVLASLEKFLWKRLKLMVNRTKSVVERPWKRKFLGYSMTVDYKPKLRVAAASIKRAKAELKVLFRQGRGRRLSSVIEDVNAFTRGWVSYYRLSQTRGVFEEMDQWLRHRLRAILWRQWKRPKTREAKMIQRGLDKERAWESAVNGRGPWWNAGASHMNACVTTQWFRAEGLLSLLEQHAALAAFT